MQNQPSTEKNRFAANEQETSRPLRVVIAYHDVNAGRRALEVLARLGGALNNGSPFEPVPWSFELLADQEWSHAAAMDAVNAEILVIASETRGPLPAAVAQWVETVLNRKQGTAAAVVALLGPKENPDVPGTPRLESIRSAAMHAGLDFFAPTPCLQSIPRGPKRLAAQEAGSTTVRSVSPRCDAPTHSDREWEHSTWHR